MKSELEHSTADCWPQFQAIYYICHAVFACLTRLIKIYFSQL